MTKSSRIKINNKKELFTHYTVLGVPYKRIPFLSTNEDEKNCDYCGCSSGRLHRLGCQAERSVCKLHPGRMIDCPCDYDSVDKV